jgi:hypothetical protein
MFSNAYAQQSAARVSSQHHFGRPERRRSQLVRLRWHHT